MDLNDNIERLIAEDRTRAKSEYTDTAAHMKTIEIEEGSKVDLSAGDTALDESAMSSSAPDDIEKTADLSKAAMLSKMPKIDKDGKAVGEMPAPEYAEPAPVTDEVDSNRDTLIDSIKRNWKVPAAVAALALAGVIGFQALSNGHSPSIQTPPEQSQTDTTNTDKPAKPEVVSFQVIADDDPHGTLRVSVEGEGWSASDGVVSVDVLGEDGSVLATMTLQPGQSAPVDVTANTKVKLKVTPPDGSDKWVETTSEEVEIKEGETISVTAHMDVKKEEPAPTQPTATQPTTSQSNENNNSSTNTSSNNSNSTNRTPTATQTKTSNNNTSNNTSSNTSTSNNNSSSSNNQSSSSSSTNTDPQTVQPSEPQTPEEPAHEHVWEPVYKTVVDTREVWVSNPVQVSDGWVVKLVFDGKTFSSEDEVKSYIREQESAGREFDSYQWDDQSYEKFHEEDQGHMETIETGSRQVIDYYICNGCGERSSS